MVTLVHGRLILTFSSLRHSVMLLNKHLAWTMIPAIDWLNAAVASYVKSRMRTSSTLRGRKSLSQCAPDPACDQVSIASSPKPCTAMILKREIIWSVVVALIRSVKLAWVHAYSSVHVVLDR
jgi:hypothetical protein